MSSGKKSRGRQKVEMKRMTVESNLQVTFSKRRNGLFKKASELCTLCGVDVALVICSPGEKVYSFGHPNVDTIIDRYLAPVPHQNNGTMRFIEAQRSANIHELNSRLTLTNNMLDVENMRRGELSQILNVIETQYWWARPVDGMNLDQLEFLTKLLMNLKNLIAQYTNRHEIQGAPVQTLPFFGGDGLCSNSHVHHQPNPQQDQAFLPFFDGNGSSSNMHVIQGAPTQTQPFFGGNGASSNLPLHHPPNPQQNQNFSAQLFENAMLQPHLFRFNNMGGGERGYGPSGFS
ncbi:hypothetical protein TSUD_286580 [Trifolium subterraneum]|uniref:MADS-box domain-containing protein n=1 Tax=Trifolium subterraneum TaxID=3900 RepID=A0A2Z6NLD9_TRISU|nr:hypothetical protein TSUD_286580 [Trifolium subterraneum]